MVGVPAVLEWMRGETKVVARQKFHRYIYYTFPAPAFSPDGIGYLPSGASAARSKHESEKRYFFTAIGVAFGLRFRSWFFGFSQRVQDRHARIPYTVLSTRGTGPARTSYQYHGRTDALYSASTRTC